MKNTPFLCYSLGKIRKSVIIGKDCPIATRNRETDGAEGGFRGEILHCGESVGEDLLRPLHPYFATSTVTPA